MEESIATLKRCRELLAISIVEKIEEIEEGGIEDLKIGAAGAVVDP